MEQVLDSNKSQVADDLSDGNEASVRLDYSIDRGNRFFIQFNWARSRDNYSSANGLRGFTNPSILTTPNFQVSFIHTLTTGLLNEFRAGYALNGNAVAVPLPRVPSIEPDDDVLGFGTGEGVPQSYRENIYNYSDFVSITHGKHNLKAGGEIRRNIENTDVNAGRPGYEFFNSLFFAIDAPYLEDVGVDPGFASGTPAQLATSVRHWRNWDIGTFLKDDWKVSRWLTLNLGLRYDLYTQNEELNNLATTFIKGPGQNFVDDCRNRSGTDQSGEYTLPRRSQSRPRG